MAKHELWDEPHVNVPRRLLFLLAEDARQAQAFTLAEHLKSLAVDGARGHVRRCINCGVEAPLDEPLASDCDP